MMVQVLLQIYTRALLRRLHCAISNLKILADLFQNLPLCRGKISKILLQFDLPSHRGVLKGLRSPVLIHHLAQLLCVSLNANSFA